MGKIKIFFFIFGVCLALIMLDMQFNGYFKELSLQANLQQVSSNAIKEAEDQAFVTKIKALDPEIELKTQNQTNNLFNKIDLVKIEELEGTNCFLFTKNGVNYLNLYTFQFQNKQNLTNYLKLKNIFQNIETNNLSLNEVNDYGLNSFYINDTLDIQSVNIIVFNQEYLLGVEYAKENTPLIKPLLNQILADKTQ